MKKVESATKISSDTSYADVASTSVSMPHTTNLPIVLTVPEASSILRLDPRTIRTMLRAGELEGNQKGHAIRVSRSSVLDWLSGKRRVPRSKR